MKTEKGDIVFALYPERAPVTTANFLAYVDGGLYDGAAFYRTTRPDNDPMIEVIQGGLWAPWREGEEGYAFAAPLPDIAHETTATTGLSHTGGTLSMARDAPGTASSEIFVTIGDNTALDYGGARNPDGQGFAAFGKVVDGMDVVRAIQAGATDASLDGAVMAGQLLDEPVKILSVRRE
ncbi:MAG TPA: peptidylprolyl isomerase [Parvularculaceae bacterium]|nr:peptidylprolyl isomerase [Parvularculaceae bacterium]